MDTNNNISVPQPTPVSDWGRKPAPAEEGFVTELPTGNYARVRRTLDFALLLKSGKIPNPLRGVLQKMMEQKTDKFPIEEMNQQMTEQLLNLLHSNTCRVMLEPRVSRPDPKKNDESEDQYLSRLEEWIPDKGTLSIFEIDLQDQLYLFWLGQGAAADLQKFRREQAALVVNVQDVEDVRDKAVDSVGVGQPT